MHAILQTSVLAPHLAPRMTSGDLYCRVWMSFVKWCPTQHALPKSAILTEIVSKDTSSAGFEVEVDEDFPRSMPETLFASMSL